jgi:glycosyltransferase involved in cell wall biosynthesis
MLTHNRAHYIEAAIESVLQQSYTNWELVIIDNGSTDNTSDVVTRYHDERIRYIRHEENTGLKRRSEFLKHTNGTYMAVLDSDDVWNSENKLEKQVMFLDNNPTHAVVGTFAILIDTHGAEIGRRPYETSDHAIRKHILTRNQFIHSSVLMRTALFKKTRGYQPTLAEDLELFLQIGVLGKFANIPEYMTKYRIHAGATNDRGLNMARALSTIIDAHKDKYSGAFRAKLVNQFRFVKGYARSWCTHS